MDQNYRKFSTPPSQRCQRNNEDLANHTSNLIPSYSKRLWWIGVDIEMVQHWYLFSYKSLLEIPIHSLWKNMIHCKVVVQVEQKRYCSTGKTMS